MFVLLGQKHYPINYNKRKFFVYIGLALFFYLIVQLIPFGKHTFIQLAFSNILLFAYVRIILGYEKVVIFSILKKKQHE